MHFLSCDQSLTWVWMQKPKFKSLKVSSIYYTRVIIMPLYTCTKVNASLLFLKPSWDKEDPFEQMFLEDIMYHIFEDSRRASTNELFPSVSFCFQKNQSWFLISHSDWFFFDEREDINLPSFFKDWVENQVWWTCFFVSFELTFTACVASKIQVWNRQKIRFTQLDFSKIKCRSIRSQRSWLNAFLFFWW